MTLMAAGLALTASPATEAIMGALPPAKAGAGSAVNDTTREVGGTLGVAIIGSVLNSAYGGHALTALTGWARRARWHPPPGTQSWLASRRRPTSRPRCGSRQRTL
jgi:hypothetical protein